MSLETVEGEKLIMPLDNINEHIINEFGIDKTAYILAIGTISDKGTIDEIGRALSYPLDEVAQIKKEYEINPDATKMKYQELFYYFDGLLNTNISQSMHSFKLASPKPFSVSWHGRSISFLSSSNSS